MTQIIRRSADVRTQEINLAQIVTSSSSSVVLHPIVSRRGRAEHQYFTSAEQLIREYGDPDPQVSMTIQNALNFFTEGNVGWFWRVLGEDFKTACLLLVESNGVLVLRAMGIENPAEVELSPLVSDGEQAIALFYPKQGPGSYAHTQSIEIESLNVYQPRNVQVVSSAAGGTLQNATYQYQVAALGAEGRSLASLPATIVLSGLTESSGLNTISWDAVGGAIGYEVYGRVDDATYGLIATVGGGTTEFADTGALEPDTDVQPIADASGAALTDEFIVRLRENGTIVEEWVSTLLPKVGGTGIQMELEDQINPFSALLAVRSNIASLDSVPTITNAPEAFYSGGDSGTAPTSFDIARGLKPFYNKQVYEINLIVNGGIADPIVQLEMDTLAQKRGDCVALLDTPSSRQRAQTAVDYRNLILNLNSTYSALFCPDLLIADLINGKQVYTPPSGWAAALCARTDRVASPAFSPAGLNRGLLNVLKSRYVYDEGESDLLYRANVNFTRTFIGQGIALWEQQTLTGQPSALSWLSVRRIINVIKVSSSKFLMYALQEMNTDALRRSLRNSLVSYLQAIRNADGIADFDVVIDESNNTSATRNAGILVVTVILIPNIPIHEIQLQVVVSKAGVSFKEALSQVPGIQQ